MDRTQSDTPPEDCEHDWQPTFWRASACPKCGWFLDHEDGSLISPAAHKTKAEHDRGRIDKHA